MQLILRLLLGEPAGLPPLLLGERRHLVLVPVDPQVVQRDDFLAEPRARALRLPDDLGRLAADLVEQLGQPDDDRGQVLGVHVRPHILADPIPGVRVQDRDAGVRGAEPPAQVAANLVDRLAHVAVQVGDDPQLQRPGAVLQRPFLPGGGLVQLELAVDLADVAFPASRLGELQHHVVDDFGLVELRHRARGVDVQVLGHAPLVADLGRLLVIPGRAQSGERPAKRGPGSVEHVVDRVDIIGVEIVHLVLGRVPLVEARLLAGVLAPVHLDLGDLGRLRELVELRAHADVRAVKEPAVRGRGRPRPHQLVFADLAELVDEDNRGPAADAGLAGRGFAGDIRPPALKPEVQLLLQDLADDEVGQSVVDLADLPEQRVGAFVVDLLLRPADVQALHVVAEDAQVILEEQKEPRHAHVAALFHHARLLLFVAPQDAAAARRLGPVEEGGFLIVPADEGTVCLGAFELGVELPAEHVDEEDDVPSAHLAYADPELRVDRTTLQDLDAELDVLDGVLGDELMVLGLLLHPACLFLLWSIS